MPLQAKSEFALVRERLERALELPGQPVKRGTMAHEHIVYMMLTDSAARVGDEAAIRQHVPMLEELAIRDDHKPYLAIAHRAWGVAHRLAGEYTEAEKRFNMAMDLFKELETPWQMGRTHFEMGELARAVSNEDLARGYFSQALALFEGLGAVPDVDRTNAALNSLAE
jgi:tetratricopeptide (TPR) repeat protein